MPIAEHWGPVRPPVKHPPKPPRNPFILKGHR